MTHPFSANKMHVYKVEMQTTDLRTKKTPFLIRRVTKRYGPWVESIMKVLVKRPNLMLNVLFLEQFNLVEGKNESDNPQTSSFK